MPTWIAQSVVVVVEYYYFLFYFLQLASSNSWSSANKEQTAQVNEAVSMCIVHCWCFWNKKQRSRSCFLLSFSTTMLVTTGRHATSFSLTNHRNGGLPRCERAYDLTANCILKKFPYDFCLINLIALWAPAVPNSSAAPHGCPPRQKFRAAENFFWLRRKTQGRPGVLPVTYR